MQTESRLSKGELLERKNDCGARGIFSSGGLVFSFNSPEILSHGLRNEKLLIKDEMKILTSNKARIDRETSRENPEPIK